MAVHGIPEVPLSNSWPAVRRFLSELRNATLRLEKSRTPPKPVTNLAATAQPGGAVIQFTRPDADFYVLFRSLTASLDDGVGIPIGNVARFVDKVGESGITVTYWVEAWKGSARSELAGPVSATTLALTTEAAQPTAPEAREFPARDEERDRLVKL